MLQIEDLTYRIAGRTLFDGASAFISKGWKVGLVGRNGTGKSTLLRLIREEAGQGGAIRLAQGATLGGVAQEAPAIETPLLAFVMESHAELAALEAEALTATDPDRIAEIHMRLADLDAYSAEARASAILSGLGFSHEDLARPCSAFSGGWRMRAALAGVLFAEPDVLALDEPTNYLDIVAIRWLEDSLDACALGQELALLPMVAAGFLRLVTQPRVFVEPTPLEAAQEFLAGKRLAVGSTPFTRPSSGP